MTKFTSPASGDVFMLPQHAGSLLESIGKSLGDRGVITPEEIPAALSALRSAADRDKAQAKPAQDDDEQDREREPTVSLSQRAFPLIDMLERAAKKNATVMWNDA